MAKLIILLFYFIVISNYKLYSIEGYKVNQKLNVIASALNMRVAPSIKAKVINFIPYGTKVTILSKTNNKYSYAGIKGYWVKVSYKNKIGYIFDGYLTSFPAPQKGCKGIEQYLNKYFTKIGKPKITDNQGYYKSIQLYKGAKFIKASGHEYGFEELIIKNMSLEEAYLIAKLCYYNDPRSNEGIRKGSFKINKKGQIYLEGYDEDSTFGAIYSIIIKKDNNGYTYINFGFSL